MGLMRWYGRCPAPKPTIERDTRLEGAFMDQPNGFRIRPAKSGAVIEIAVYDRWKSFSFSMQTPETMAAVLEQYGLTLRGTVEDWERVEEIKAEQGKQVFQMPDPIRGEEGE